MTALIIASLAAYGLVCATLGVLLATATRRPCPPTPPKPPPDPDNWWEA